MHQAGSRVLNERDFSESSTLLVTSKPRARDMRSLLHYFSSIRFKTIAKCIGPDFSPTYASRMSLAEWHERQLADLACFTYRGRVCYSPSINFVHFWSVIPIRDNGSVSSNLEVTCGWPEAHYQWVIDWLWLGWGEENITVHVPLQPFYIRRSKKPSIVWCCAWKPSRNRRQLGDAILYASSRPESSKHTETRTRRVQRRDNCISNSFINSSKIIAREESTVNWNCSIHPDSSAINWNCSNHPD